MSILTNLFILLVGVSVVNTLVTYHDARDRIVYLRIGREWFWNYYGKGGYYKTWTYKTYEFSKDKTICHYEDKNLAPNDTVPVGFVMKPRAYCGILTCMLYNNRPTAQLIYCQEPATFAECETDAINTEGTYPECCWQCVKYKDC